MQKMMGGKWLHAVSGAALLCGMFGCGKKVPAHVIQPDAMEELLYDYHLAGAMSASLPYSESYKKEAYLQYVFQKHHVTEAEFDSSLVWYTRHGKELADIYQDLQNRFESEEKNMKALVARRDNQLEVSMSGDTVDIWQDRTLYWLTSSPLANKVLFDLKADTTFKLRDAVELVADFHFLSENDKEHSGEAVMGVTFFFSNDSVQGTTRKIHSSGRARLYLQPDSAFEIRSVSGFIYYPKGERQSASSLLINNIRLNRYHAKEPMPLPADTANVAAKLP